MCDGARGSPPAQQGKANHAHDAVAHAEHGALHDCVYIHSPQSQTAVGASFNYASIHRCHIVGVIHRFNALRPHRAVTLVSWQSMGGGFPDLRDFLGGMWVDCPIEHVVERPQPMGGAS